MYGIPYKGSKRKLAQEILNFIKERHPDCEYFYDLFGGGGAVSLCASNIFNNVFYNELDSGVANLFNFLLNNNVPDNWYQWVCREKFHGEKNLPTPYGGMIKQCWSFGNNGDSYLFSEYNENLKRPLHNVIVNLCENSLKELEDRHSIQIPNELLSGDVPINQRRLDTMRYVKSKIGRIDLEPLERLQQLKVLQQLEKFPHLKNITCTNLSYEAVPIDTPPENTIIYIDPPYRDTAKYSHSIDYDNLWAWVKDSPYTIYISEYECPFNLVYSIPHKSCFSATNNSKPVKEKLFCNKG